jgi:hypothetical protein
MNRNIPAPMDTSYATGFTMPTLIHAILYACNIHHLCRTDVPLASSVPLCRCGQPSRSQEVWKDGPNKGRFFFCCSKSRLIRSIVTVSRKGSESTNKLFYEKRDEKCDFFQFVDEAASVTKSTKTFAPPAAAVEPPCVCGEPSRSQVTHKEGANKGRVFYSCRKPRLGYLLLRSRVVMDKSCKCSFFKR